MSKKWHYATAPSSQHGTMICTACKKKIESGDYRVRETAAAYMPQHRKCSESDKHWKAIDAQEGRHKKHFENYLAACIEFKKKWDCDELDDLIYELQAVAPKKGQP